MEALLSAAFQDRSYAGIFPYESQAPMKTFEGHVPCVPFPVMKDILESHASGGTANLKAQDIAGLRRVIGMDTASCSMKCSPALWDCISSSPGQNLREKMNDSKVAACMKASMACYQSCVAHGSQA